MCSRAQRPLRFGETLSPDAGEGLLNLGPKSRAWLTGIGVASRAHIIALGPIEVCRRLRQAGHPVSVIMAYALEGAVSGTHWNQIPAETKRALRGEFARMKRQTPLGNGAT